MSKIRYVLPLFICAVCVIGCGGDDENGLASSKNMLATQVVYDLDKGYIYDWRWNIENETSSFYKKPEESNISNSKTETNTNSISGRVFIYPKQQYSNGTYRLLVEVKNVVLYTKAENGSMQPVEGKYADKLRNEMAKTFMFDQARDGRVLNVHFSTDEDVQIQNIKRGIVSNFNNQLPTNIISSSNTFSKKESDVTGNYTAEYTYSNTNTTTTVNKEFVYYSSFPGANQVIDAPVKNEVNNLRLNAKSTAVYKNQGILNNSNSTFFLQPKAPANTDYNEGYKTLSKSFSKSKIRFNTTTNNKYANSNTDFTDGFVQKSIVAEVPVTANRFNVSISEHLERLDQDAEDLAAYSDMVSILKEQPETIEDIETFLYHGNPSADGYQAIIGALSNVGSEKAQNLLQEIIKNGDPLLRSQAMVALGLVKQPIPASVELMEVMAKDIQTESGNQATLLLGIMAGNIAETDSTRSKRITHKLAASLNQAQYPEEISLYLAALGNVGDSTYINQIASYLKDEDPEIRNRAVYALRKMSNKENALQLFDESEDENTRKGQAVSKTWNYTLGDGDIKCKFEGVFNAKKYPDYAPEKGDVSIYAKAEATGYAWDFKQSVFRALGKTKPVVYGNTIKREYYAEVSVLDGLIYEENFGDGIPCGYKGEKTLWKGTRDFISLSRSFYPYGIEVRLSGSITGSLDIKYKYGITSCSAPVKVDAFGDVVVTGSIAGKGTAAVSIYVVQAGVTLMVDFFKASISANATASVGLKPDFLDDQTPIEPTLKACIGVDLDVNALAGRFYGWVKFCLFGCTGEIVLFSWDWAGINIAEIVVLPERCLSFFDPGLFHVTIDGPNEVIVNQKTAKWTATPHANNGNITSVIWKYQHANNPDKDDWLILPGNSLSYYRTIKLADVPRFILRCEIKDSIGTSTANEHTIRVKESSTGPNNYYLTVRSGSGGGYFYSGDSVQINANNPPTNQVFDRWVPENCSPQIYNINSMNTTLIMPSTNCAVVATYRDNSGGNCISDQNTLRNTLQNAHNGDTITLCGGQTILIEQELSSSAHNIRLVCSTSNGCVLNRLGTGIGRTLSLYGDNVMLRDLTFRDAYNKSGNGGAVYIQGQNAQVINCKFYYNSAVNGGGLYVSGNGTQVRNCEFKGNVAYNDGGGLYTRLYLESLVGSIFNENRANQLGGGAYLGNDTNNVGGNSGSDNTAETCSDIYYARSGSCGWLQ